MTNNIDGVVLGTVEFVEVKVLGKSRDEQYRNIGVQVDKIMTDKMQRLEQRAMSGSPVDMIAYNIAIRQDTMLKVRLRISLCRQLDILLDSQKA